MPRSEPGADRILPLRGIHLNHRLKEFWKARLYTRAACYNAFSLAA